VSPPRPSGLLRAIALVAAGTLGFGACAGDDGDDRAGGVVELSDGTIPPDGPGIALDGGPSGRRVAMIGDSITVGSTAGLESAAEALGVDLTIDAQVGRRITVGGNPNSGVDAVGDVLDDVGAPDLWVVALGTNDVGQYSTAEQYAAQIDALLALVPPDAPVVWVDVFLRDRAEASGVFNTELRRKLDARGNASIGAWTDLAGGDGVLSDGIHPSDVGTELFVQLVSGEIEDWLEQ
jgi:lysophospholipase L1-like esterase